ncbi:MAG: extracellular solute-binding protein [Nitrososphaerales archaeon]
MRKDLGKKTLLKRGISTTIAAIIVVILVIATGAAAYYYAASTVTGTTSTSIHTSVQTSTQVSTVVSTVKSTPKPVTITIWETYAPSSSVDSEFGAFNQSLTAFKAAYPYITVNVQTHPSSSAQADFTTASLANQAPDVIRIANDWTGAFVAEGFLTPIDQFTNSTFLGQYYPASIQDYQYRGHTWGLPENINHIALIYNKALVPNPPTTTDQLITMAQSITKVDATCKITTAGIVFNAAGGFGSGYWWWPFLDGFGGSAFSATNPTQPAINSSAAVASVQFLNGLVTDPNPVTHCNGVMPPGVDYSTADTLFISGHAGMIINGPWDISTYKGNTSLNFGVAALPTVSSTGKPLAPFIGSQGWAIASDKSADETAAAFKFIAWMTNFNSEKNMVTLAGDLPAIQALASDPSVTGNPDSVGFLAQAANGAPAVNIPEMGVVYSNIGGPLGTVEPSSSTSTITAAQIQTALNTAEAAMLRAIGSIG